METLENEQSLCVHPVSYHLELSCAQCLIGVFLAVWPRGMPLSGNSFFCFSENQPLFLVAIFLNSGRHL